VKLLEQVGVRIMPPPTREDECDDLVIKCAEAILARVEETRPRSLDRDMLIEEIGKAFAGWSDLKRKVTGLQRRIAILEARLAIRP
jgi:hypothetical protein